MRTIWKYPLEQITLQDIEMPVNAKILCVQTQGGTPMLWVEVDIEAPTVSRQIAIFSTGYNFDMCVIGRKKYIGTFQQGNGEFVFHVYEVI